VTLVVVV